MKTFSRSASALTFLVLLLNSAAVGAEDSPGASEPSHQSGMEDPEDQSVEAVKSLLERKLGASVDRVFKHPREGKEGVLFIAQGNFGTIASREQAKDFLDPTLFGLSSTDTLTYSGFSSNTYSFNQRINGIAVYGGGVQLLVNEQDQLVQITNTTMPRSDASESPPVRKAEEVESAGLDAIRKETETAFPRVTKMESEVFHDRHGGYLWLVSVTLEDPTGRTLEYQASVRDADLEAVASPLFFPITGRVCDAEGNPTTECTASEPVLVAGDGTCPGGPNQQCTGSQILIDAKKAWDNVEAMETIWESTPNTYSFWGNNCCEIGDSGQIEISANSTAPGDDLAVYQTVSKAIGVIEGELGDKGIIGHELGHALTHLKAPFWYVSSQNNTAQAKAVIEGFADVNGLILKNSASTGNWEIGGRVLSQTPPDFQTQGSVYQNARVVGYVYYRMVTQHGVPANAAKQIFLDTLSHSNAKLKTDPYLKLSFALLRDSMLAVSVASHDPKIVDAWDDALVPAGLVVVPVKVSSVWASHLYCSIGVSYNTVSWNNVASAQNYKVYYRNLVGNYQLAHTTSNTAVLAWSPYSTIWKIKACNGTGCASLSSAGAWTYDCPPNPDDH